jgi:uncharacterized protein (DUF4213/DUF364 family)
MSILAEAAELATDRLGNEAQNLAIDRLVIGLFFTGVKLDNGFAGMSFTPTKDIPEAVCCPSSVGRTFDPVGINGTKVTEILPSLESPEPIKRAVAVAALNALSAMCWSKGLTGGHTLRERSDAQDYIKIRSEYSVAVFGAIVPVLRMLKKRGGTWWVVEQDPKTLKDDELPHYVPWGQSEEIIGKADALIITGVSLLNRTLEPILSLAGAGAEIAVLGPTASMLPEPMFRRGVRIVGGVWVKRPDELLNVLASGGSGYHLFDEIATRIVWEREL